MQRLRELYTERKKEISQRLNELSQVKRAEDIFYELCFCIMAAQTSGLKSWEITEKLKFADFLNNGINPKKFLRQGYIRFHHTKTNYLLEARKKFYDIRKKLNEISDAAELRAWLIGNVKGLGMKEASHFLRNIGKTQHLAILDRHILKNMKEYRIITDIPKTLTKKKYFELEEKFQDFAKQLRMKPAELDLLFWAKEVGVVFK